ncbi:MAG: uracil-xanthine permease family protein, partial [Peptococcales bacterium]
DSWEQTIYLQKLFFVTAITLLAQIYWGHGLPLIVGPASVLLVGIVASQSSSIDSVYTSIMVGGLVLAILSMTGLFAYLKVLFTPRVVAGTLILIAFTLTPMITNLITTAPQGVTGFSNIVFALSFILCMFVANRNASGIWKSTLIIWAILIGSVVYNYLFPGKTALSMDYYLVSTFFKKFTFNITLEPGMIISFLICFLALAINDLGSIQSVSELIHPDNKEKRITRGITFTGLGNILSGFFGVIGTVNFSLSPGVIVSTRCASKYTLVPLGLGLMILSFLPSVIAFMGSIPSVVTGSVLVYIMCSQIAAGLLIAFNAMGEFTFEHGLVMGLSLMLSILTSFLPVEVLNTFPTILRPILGNGFVVGVLTVLVMEHLIFKPHIK